MKFRDRPESQNEKQLWKSGRESANPGNRSENSTLEASSVEFLTEFRDRWRSRKFRNNGHACTSIVVQINTDDEKDGFELFTGTMMYFRVLLYVREFTEQHHFRTSGPGRSLPVDSGCCSADLKWHNILLRRIWPFNSRVELSVFYTPANRSIPEYM